jgi:hypothetical protein
MVEKIIESVFVFAYFHLIIINYQLRVYQTILEINDSVDLQIYISKLII